MRVTPVAVRGWHHVELAVGSIKKALAGIVSADALCPRTSCCRALQRQVEVTDARSWCDASSIAELILVRDAVNSLLARATGGPGPETSPTAPHRPHSLKLRVAAARVRVSSDRQVGRSTPQWIRDLANTGIDRRGA